MDRPLHVFVHRVTDNHVTGFLHKTTQDKMALPSDYHSPVVGLLLNFFNTPLPDEPKDLHKDRPRICELLTQKLATFDT